MSISDIENYFRSYDKKTYNVFSQRGAEPTIQRIEEFEREIGFRLPDDFRTYSLHPLGGIYMEVKDELWPRPKAYDVGPFWSFLYGFYVYTFSDAAPDWLSIQGARNEMRENGYPQLIPFLKIRGDADPYCFTADGKIVVWQHEMPDEPAAIDKTFMDVLMAEIKELEARKERKLNAR